MEACYRFALVYSSITFSAKYDPSNHDVVALLLRSVTGTGTNSIVRVLKRHDDKFVSINVFHIIQPLNSSYQS